MNAVSRETRFAGFYSCDLFDCPAFRMFTAWDCPRADNILGEKRFEPQSMALWCSLVHRATSILDIGANVGVYSLAAASLRKDVEIHAFEPNPYAAARLRLHKRVNGFGNITEHLAALSDKAGAARFSWVDKGGKISSGGALGARVEGIPNESCVVEMITLDSLDISFGSRPLVKIDVEGGELRAVQGATKLCQAKPDIILESFSQAKCDLIAQHLPEGFSVYRIHEDGGLERLNLLTAAVYSVHDYNQFITWRPEELVSLVGPDAMRVTHGR